MKRIAFLLLLALLPGCRWGSACMSVSHTFDDGTRFSTSWTTEDWGNDRPTF